MTRMPDSRPLILKRVWRMAVVAAASIPAPNATPCSTSGCTFAAMRTPATAPPSVIDPSAVMSGNAKMRKLMKTPNASSDRISPMVNAPTTSSMSGNRRDPARAAHELALAGTRGAAIVVQEMHHAEQLIRLEQPRDGVGEIDVVLLYRPEDKCRGMQMTDAVAAQRPNLCRMGGVGASRRQSGDERHGTRIDTLGGVR